MTAMETELTPAEVIAQADSEIQEAEKLANELENRVREGDESVGYEQVERARGLMGFARLRREAAEKKAAILAQKQAKAEFEAFLQRHLDGAAGRDEQVEELLGKAREYIDEALSVVRATDRHVYALAKRAETPGNPYHPDENPELVGEAAHPEYAWFAARGVRMEVLGAGGMLVKLLTPYRSDVNGLGRYSELKSAI